MAKINWNKQRHHGRATQAFDEETNRLAEQWLQENDPRRWRPKSQKKRPSKKQRRRAKRAQNSQPQNHGGTDPRPVVTRPKTPITDWPPKHASEVLPDPDGVICFLPEEVDTMLEREGDADLAVLMGEKMA